MSDHEVAPENPQNPNPDWECNDIPIGMLIKSAIGTFAVVAIAFVGMIPVFNHYNNAEDAKGENIPDWIAERALPEGDHLLQSTPRVDLAEYENNSAEVLNTYGWSDAEAKVARIPIADAKKHMLTQIYKTVTEDHGDHAGHDHEAPAHAEKAADKKAPAPHGHPGHNHATDHVPAKAEKVDAHAGHDHSGHDH